MCACKGGWLLCNVLQCVRSGGKYERVCVCVCEDEIFMTILSASWMLIGTCESAENRVERWRVEPVRNRRSDKYFWPSHFSICLSVLALQTLLHPYSHLPPAQTLLPFLRPSSLSFCFLSQPLPKRLDEGLSTVMMCVCVCVCVCVWFTWQALVCVGCDETCRLHGL